MNSEPQEILVEYPEFASYPTLREALAASSREERLAKAKQDSLLLQNKTILDYRVYQHEVEWLLSDNVLLRFAVADDRVHWAIQENSSFSSQMPLDPPKKLLLRHSPTESPYLWERDRFLQERVGRTVRGISVADVWTIFYASRIQELMFSRINIADTEEAVLYFSTP